MAADPQTPLLVLEHRLQIAGGKLIAGQRVEISVAPSHQPAAARSYPQVAVVIACQGADERAEPPGGSDNFKSLAAVAIEGTVSGSDPQRPVGVGMQRGDRCIRAAQPKRHDVEALAVEALQAPAPPTHSTPSRSSSSDWMRTSRSPLAGIERDRAAAVGLEQAALRSHHIRPDLPSTMA